MTSVVLPGFDRSQRAGGQQASFRQPRISLGYQAAISKHRAVADARSASRCHAPRGNAAPRRSASHPITRCVGTREVVVLRPGPHASARSRAACGANRLR